MKFACVVAAVREPVEFWTRSQRDALGSLGAKHSELVGTSRLSMGQQVRFLIFQELSAATLCALVLQELGDPGVSVGVHELDGGVPRDVGLESATQLVERGTPGRLWVSKLVFDLSRRAGLRWRSRSKLAWLAHGSFRESEGSTFEFFEIGSQDGPTQLGPSVGSAQRADDTVLRGWRPAKGQEFESAPAWRFERWVSATPFSEKWQVIHREKQKRRFVELFWDRRCLERLRSQAFSLRQWQRNLKRCPKVVRLYYFDLEASRPFLATGVEEGESLAARSDLARAELPIKLFVAAQVAEILEAAHRCGVLHGELDASDVLLRTQPGGIPTVQLRGFVVPKKLGDPSRFTIRRTVADDFKALGLLIYRLLIGDFEACDAEGSLAKIPQLALRELVGALLGGLTSQPYGRLRPVIDALLGFEETSPENSTWPGFQSRSVAREVVDRDVTRRSFGRARETR